MVQEETAVISPISPSHSRSEYSSLEGEFLGHIKDTLYIIDCGNPTERQRTSVKRICCALGTKTFDCVIMDFKAKISQHCACVYVLTATHLSHYKEMVSNAAWVLQDPGVVT